METRERDRGVTQTQNLLFDELPRSRDPVFYIVHQVEGTQIEQRRNDGYIDATAMCRAYGKTFDHYNDVQHHKEVFKELEVFLNTGIPVIRSERGRHGGTWIHPQLAIHLATWLSPKFCVQVMSWVLEWMQGRQPVLHKNDLEPFVIGRLVQETHAIVSRIDQQNGRIVDTVAHIDERTEGMAVRQQEIQLDLWRVISDEPPKSIRPEPLKSQSRGLRGQPIPRLHGFDP